MKRYLFSVGAIFFLASLPALAQLGVHVGSSATAGAQAGAGGLVQQTAGTARGASDTALGVSQSEEETAERARQDASTQTKAHHKAKKHNHDDANNRQAARQNAGLETNTSTSVSAGTGNSGVSANANSSTSANGAIQSDSGSAAGNATGNGSANGQPDRAKPVETNKSTQQPKEKEFRQNSNKESNPKK